MNSDMDQAMAAALSYPTLPLSILVVFIFLYWLLSATGLVGDHHHELHHHHHHDLSHLHHGHHGHHDLEHVSLAGLLSKFGLTSVPMTILISALAFFMWSVTYYTHLYFLAGLPTALRYGLGTLTIVGSFFLAVPLAALALFPFRWLMGRVAISSNEEKDMRGKEGTVLSEFVNDQGGRVSINDGGAGIILYAKTLGGKVIPRDASIVVVAYDKLTGGCEVVPKEDFT